MGLTLLAFLIYHMTMIASGFTTNERLKRSDFMSYRKEGIKEIVQFLKEFEQNEKKIEELIKKGEKTTETPESLEKARKEKREAEEKLKVFKKELKILEELENTSKGFWRNFKEIMTA